MPARDTIHDAVVSALQNDGWTITDDPLKLDIGDQMLFVDLGAEWADSAADAVLAAQNGEREIAVEVKSFSGASTITELYLAVGQYMVYQLALSRLAPMRTLYLAISDHALANILSMPVGQIVVTELPLNLIVVDVESSEVTQWIAANNTPES